MAWALWVFEGRGNHESKSPEGGVCLVSWKSSKIIVAVEEWRKERLVGNQIHRSCEDRSWSCRAFSQCKVWLYLWSGNQWSILSKRMTHSDVSFTRTPLLWPLNWELTCREQGKKSRGEMRIHVLTTSFAYCEALLSKWHTRPGRKTRRNVGECSCSLWHTYSALDCVWRLDRSQLTFPGSHDKRDGDSEREKETVPFLVFSSS